MECYNQRLWFLVRFGPFTSQMSKAVYALAHVTIPSQQFLMQDGKLQPCPSINGGTICMDRARSNQRSPLATTSVSVSVQIQALIQNAGMRLRWINIFQNIRASANASAVVPSPLG